MKSKKVFLIIGAVISALIAVLHFILGLKPELYALIAPGQMSALSEMAVEGSSLTTILSFVIALIFALWALYAFSGAGVIARFPALRAALIVIGVIYCLRGLFLITEIGMVRNEGYPFRFVLYSSLSLIAGLLYLIGVIGNRSLPRRTKHVDSLI